MRFATLCLAVMLAVAVLGLTSTLRAAAPAWTVDRDASRVGFVAQQSGDPVPGEFRNFEADIRFDPEQLGESRVDVRIKIASVDAGGGERNQTITSPSLFHAGKYPNARFTAESFREGANGDYIAQGELTMRGTTHPVDLPFDLAITRSAGTLRAVAEGAVTVKRLRWGIGQGQWESTNMVPNAVRIEIRIVATRPAD